MDYNSLLQNTKNNKQKNFLTKMLNKPNQTVRIEKQEHNPFRPNNKSKSLTTVRQLITELDLSTKIRHHSQKKKQVFLDREQIRKQLKQKWRGNYSHKKDPGYCNLQFSTNKALKGKFLNEWEIERVYMATRSYQAPKSNFISKEDSKGFKQCIQSREFPKVSKQTYSEKFQKYLTTIEEKNQNQLFNTKKIYTEDSTATSRNSNRLTKQKEKFQAFTTQNKSFGMGTILWKTGDNRKFKTIEDC